MNDGIMNVEPLTWPAFRAQAGYWQLFTRDVPYIGLDSRTRRKICRDLEQRSVSALKLWESDKDNLAILMVVSPIIQENFRWPNLFFIPDDPCEIILWEYSGAVDFAFASTIRNIKKILEVPESIFENLESVTYGELIERIKEYTREGGLYERLNAAAIPGAFG